MLPLRAFLLTIFCVRYVISEDFYVGGLFDDGGNKEEVFKWVINLMNRNLEYHQLIPLIHHIQLDDPLQAFIGTCSFLNKGVAVVFGTETEINSGAIQSVCDTKEIPLIEMRWNRDPPRGTTLVNFYPHAPIFSKALVDIVLAWEWKSFTILYENNDSILRIGEVLKLMQVNKINPIRLEQLDKNTPGIFRESLRNIKKSGQKRIIIDCSSATLEEVLHQAQQLGLMTQDYSYIITNPDFFTMDLEEYVYGGTNITGISMINPQIKGKEKLIKEIYSQFELDIPININLTTALLIDAVAMFANALNELSKAPNFRTETLQCNSSENWEFGYSLVNYIKTSVIKGLTGVVKFDNEGFRSDFSLQLYELTEQGADNVGMWNTTDGLKLIRAVEEFQISEESVANRTFKVIIALTAPYGMLTQSDTKLTGNDRFEGFGIDLIKEMAILLGFNYTFILRDDKANGKQDAVTLKWSGMIGDVIDEIADLAITDLTINSDREKAVDFTSTFMTLGISILFKKPKKAPPSFFSFAEPFALDVWLSLAAACFSVSIALFIIGRLTPDEWDNPYPCIEEPEFLTNQFSLRNSFWFTVGSIMTQGSEIAPIATSSRMVGGLWSFFTLIMVSSYTANLAAFLTTENPDAPFSNVTELVRNADKYGIKYGAKINGATDIFFRDSNDTLYRQIHEYMDKNYDDVMVDDNDIGVSKAINESYAFFMESTSIEYEIERKCELTRVGDLLDEKNYGIAMRKNSSYRKVLSTAILKLHANGKIGELKRKWWQERRGGGQCKDAANTEGAKALNLKNVEGVFYVTIGGTILAAIFVFLEMILHVIKDSIKNKISLKESFKHEINFYLNFNKTVKPVIQRNSRSKSKSSTSKSIESEINSEDRKDAPPFGFIINEASK